MNTDEEDPSRLAITVDMIMGYNAQTKKQLGKNYGLAQLAVHTAQIMGYTTTLSRVSEYVQVPGEAEHLLLSENIMFETLTKELMMRAHAVGKLVWSEIQGCVVDILSAKNDKQHKGNRPYFGLANMADPNQAYCITELLWRYTMAEKPQKGRSNCYITWI